MNGIDRFHLALAALEQVTRVSGWAAQLRDELLERFDRAHAYACRFGEDPPGIADWGRPA
jgi:xylulose-5-phosphate/fructose-6-phosphate phosphoketolase